MRAGRRAQVAAIQRARLLAAAVSVVDERGYGRVTVAQITARARVSRRTFYDLFENVEDCLCAVVRDILETVERQLDPGGELAGLVWRERVRLGLWQILCFFDAQPALARVLVVHSLKGGPGLAAERERALERLVGVVDAGRRENKRQRQGGELTLLSAEAVVGAVAAIVAARLARREHAESLSSLLGELSAIVVLPYFGAAAARREQTRALPAPARAVAGASSGGYPSSRPPVEGGEEPLAGLPMRLTYRTARVLESVAAHAGASNREIADLAGIADQGQVSKLLRRLQRLGLLANGGEGAHAKGEANAWALTDRGEQVTRSFRMYTTTTTHERAT